MAHCVVTQDMCTHFSDSHVCVATPPGESCEYLTFSDASFKGLPCAHTLHMVEAWVDGLFEGGFTSKLNAAEAAALHLALPDGEVRNAAVVAAVVA